MVIKNIEGIRQTEGIIKEILHIMNSPFASASIIEQCREILTDLQSNMDAYFQSKLDEIKTRRPDQD